MDEDKKRLAVFSRGDDSFINDIIEKLSEKYETKKISIRSLEEMKLIDEWMNWADICWFEWCDSLIAYGSRLPAAAEKKIICRLHSYEAFTNLPSQVNWSNVDRLIFVSGYIRDYVVGRWKLSKDITAVIPNGIDPGKWAYNKRGHGFKIAFAGYINYKKGPMLLLHAFKAIHDRDGRYTLHIAGQYQDPRYALYFKQMTRELGLEGSLFFEGWQKDLDKWLEDKSFILCSSLLESQNMSVMQAMAKGIKPVVHNFAGAENIYPGKYLWNTIEEAAAKITEPDYSPEEYRKFIEGRYSLEDACGNITILLEGLYSGRSKAEEGFDYRNYWNKRLNSSFNVQGVGYMGLGEIYNDLLYRNRLYILDAVLKKTFGGLGNAKVLELGPGIGVFTEYFKNTGISDYFAIDIAEKSVAELSAKYEGYRFKLGDISDPGVYDGKYDLILASDVLLHITNGENYRNAVSNISEALDENGLCIFFDPVSTAAAKSASRHVVIRSLEQVENVLFQNGLVLVDMLPVANFMNYPFDHKLLGPRGNYALEAFGLISSVFSGKAVNDNDKRIIGEYLLYREKGILYRFDFGLSEKILIIQKKQCIRDIRYNNRELMKMEQAEGKSDIFDQLPGKVSQKHQSIVLRLKDLIDKFEGI